MWSSRGQIPFVHPEYDEEIFGPRQTSPHRQPEDDKTTSARKDLMEGITPVELPMPYPDRNVFVQGQIVTTERPLAPRLFYITSTLLYPFYLSWFLCLVYSCIAIFPRFKPLLEKMKKYREKPSTGEQIPGNPKQD
jgi:hypothetical protein